MMVRKIYGKTGSGSDGEAWLLDSLRKIVRGIILYRYLGDAQQKENISGNTAKEIALKNIE